jgi:hypothetical protein
MGHIKEPKGVDFVISSDPLTDIAREEISEFIRNYRNKTTRKKLSSKKGATSKHSKSVH